MTCDHTSYNFTCVQLRNGDHSGTQCTVQCQSVEATIIIKVCGKLSLGKNWHAKGSERPISGGGDERQKDRCHVPKRISAVCSMFLQEDSLILCQVNNPGACLIQTTFPSSMRNPMVDLTDINPDRRYRVIIQADMWYQFGFPGLSAWQQNSPDQHW